MKAIVYRKYGSPEVLKCEEKKEPTAGADEVLIKVHAGSVNPLDWHFIRGTPYAVQIAKAFHADVTGVCSTRNLDMVRSIGADRIIDYTRQNFTQSGERYDLIFDLVGNHSLSACRCALNPKGMYVGAGGTSDRWMIGPLIRLTTARVFSQFVSQKLVTVLARSNRNDLIIMCDLMKTGKVKPVIDKRYRLSEVPEAIRYLEQGHAQGKVIITAQCTNGT